MTDAHADGRRFAYSEHVTAGSLSRSHISPVDGELKRGGNAPAPLCWTDDKGRWSGWHISLIADADDFASYRDAGSLCAGCVLAYEKETRDATPAD